MREETKDCPYCGYTCEADWCDVGVGYLQVGPYYCEMCGASEIGAYDKPRELSEIERKTGWYGPHSEPGSSANVINGRVISHIVMKNEYRKEFKDNPLWNDKAYVENWYKDKRKAR